MLTPGVLAKKTFGSVNTNDLAALGTGPPFLFVFNKLTYPEFPYILEVAHHTHAILRAIALIELLQPGARKAVTAEAEPGAALDDLLAVLDDASGTGDRFEMIVTQATGTSILIPDICEAQATVHSARCDQGRSHSRCLYRFIGCHVGIPSSRYFC
jgi:hypothetical protein